MAYRDEILNLNPAAYWRLGESSRTTATDEIGSNNGTYIGSPTLGSTGLLVGDSDTAVTFSANTPKYVSVPSVLDTSQSVVFLIKFDDVKASMILQSTSSPSFILLSGKFQAYVSGTYYDTGYTAVVGNIYHIVLTMVNGDFKVYVNGGLEATFNCNKLPALRYIGSEPFPGGWWVDGTMDEVAVFNYILTAQNVTTLYNSAIAYIAPLVGEIEATLDNVDSFMLGNYQVPVGTFGSILNVISSITGSFKDQGLILSTLDNIVSRIFSDAINLDIQLVLTGYIDGLDNVTYNLSSFSTKQNSGDNSTFKFEIPNQLGVMESYNERRNGDLIVYYLGNEIIRCKPQLATYTTKPESQTFSIRGNKQETYTNNKTITIAGNRVSNISTASTGKRVFTALDFIDINPLDSITYESETIQIEKLSLSVGITGFKYSLTEL